MYESVPQELKSLPNWVGWKLEIKNSKPTKVPYSRPGVNASTKDPKAWVNFNDVCNIMPSKEKGIGFVFNGNGIIGIDLDHCFNLDGTVVEKFKIVESHVFPGHVPGIKISVLAHFAAFFLIA